MKEVDVHVNGVLCGRLFKEGEESYIFRYTEKVDASNFVSLTMPVRTRDWDYRVLHPVFQMNLPEGYNLDVLTRKFAKLIELEDIDLLSMIGTGGIGRISFSKPGEKPGESISPDINYNLLMKTKGARDYLADLIENNAGHIGISGVQPKLMASLMQAKPKKNITIPSATHIYKTSQEYSGVSANEYFCMKACAKTQLTVPDVSLSDDGDVISVKRFDVLDEGRRMGFEEIIVLNALTPDGKYRGSYEANVAGVIKTFSGKMSRRKSLTDLFSAVVMCVGLRNGDAHLKNFGLIYSSIDDAKLSPIYDMVTTGVHVPNDVMALTLNDSKDWPNRDSLMKFATAACEIQPSLANKIIDQCITAIRGTMDEVRDFGAKNNTDYAKKLSELMLKQWTAGINSLGSQKPVPMFVSKIQGKTSSSKTSKALKKPSIDD